VQRFEFKAYTKRASGVKKAPDKGCESRELLWGKALRGLGNGRT